MSFIEIQIDGEMAIRKKFESMTGINVQIAVSRAIIVGLKPVLQRAKSNAMGMVGGVMGSMITTALRIKPFRRQKKHSYGMNVQISKEYNSAFQHTTRGGKKYYIPAAVQYGHKKPYSSLRMSNAKALIKDEYGRTKKNRHVKNAMYDVLNKEYGSDKVPAIPFMRKAADIELTKSPQIFSEILKKELDI